MANEKRPEWGARFQFPENTEVSMDGLVMKITEKMACEMAEKYDDFIAESIAEAARAAAFAKTYRKIMDAKRENLFPEIVKPVMPVQFSVVNHHVVDFRAVVAGDDDRRRFMSDEEYGYYVENKLAMALGGGLLRQGVAKVETQPIIGVFGCGNRHVATVKVVLPDGSQWP